MANYNPKRENLKSYKPKWKSGKTQTIRVPIAISDLVLEAAKEIDTNGNKSLLQVIESQNKLILELKEKLCQSDISDTSDIEREKIIQIAQEAFNTKSSFGGKIKEAIVSILQELNIPVSKVNRNWLIGNK